MELIEKLNLIKNIKNNKELLFVHTPKCGGTFTKSILKDLNIKIIGHKQPTEDQKENFIIFTVIRDPIKRFESLLNYRLQETKPRNDWPKNLEYMHYDKSISLNKIIEEFDENDFEKIRPYKTLTYWTENVDICITINQLKDFLSFFSYNINLDDYPKKNVSQKERGELNEKSIEKLSNIYKNDIELFNENINEKIDINNLYFV